MSDDVTFNTEDAEASGYAPYAAAPKRKGLLALVVSWGIAKDEKGAQMLLLGVAIICVITAATVSFFVLKPKTPHNPYVEGQNVLAPPLGK